MKKISKLLCFMLVFITVMAAFCTVSFAATVGQTLTSPEPGWQRIDDNDPKVFYSGNSALENGTKTGGSYNSTLHRFANGGAGFVKFKFYGTKFRVIANFSPTAGYSADIRVNIDGITEGSFSNIGSSFVWQVLMYEKKGMELGFHEVILLPQDSTTYGGVLDAIDIDDTGYLVDCNIPSNLLATPGNTKVGLSWDAVDGATSYIVKRATTPGGPYETITTTAAITYTDSDVTNGTTYYYVVTAIVNNVESDPSNEASATPAAPTDPEPSGNNAILEITMVTGEIKEYGLTAAELQSFLTWYDGRSNGTDKAYYMIPKKNNIKPFLSRKEYIAYDKISSFEVKEYTE